MCKNFMLLCSDAHELRVEVSGLSHCSHTHRTWQESACAFKCMCVLGGRRGFSESLL